MGLNKSAITSGDRLSAFSADRLGMWASTACVLHCMLTPALLSFSAVFAHLLPSEEHTHRFLAVAITAIGAISLLYGYRRHRRIVVPLLMAAGLVFIFAGAWWGDRLPSHRAEVAITMMGSALMITAHRMNHTFCRNCSCATKSLNEGG